VDWAFGAPTSDPRWLSTFVRFATAGVVLLGIGLRFLFLDADPHYYAWAGYITDEGRWTDRARELALFGRMLEPPWSLHVLVAPLFQVANYVTFALTDVSVLSSRLLSAVSGSLVLVTFWAALRRTTTPEALFLGLVPLAFQVDLVTLSRVAVPEMPIIALQLALYLAITSGYPSMLRRFGTGLLALLTVAMKITAVPVVGILSLLLLRPPTSPGDTDRRAASFLAFMAGFVGPVFLLGLVLLACCPQVTDIAGSTVKHLQPFLGVSSARRVISFPFEDPLSSELNLWGLAVWYALIGWGATRSDAIDPKPRRYLLTSAAWCGLYLGSMLLASYFPNRYKVHVLLPMCITVAVGIGLFQRAGITRAESAFTAARSSRRLAGLALLGLPTAVFASPLVADVVGVFGGDPSRHRAKMVALAMSLIAMTLILEWCRRRHWRLTFFMIFPVVSGLTWLVTQRSGFFEVNFWPAEGAPQSFVTRLIPLLAAAILSVAIAVRPRSFGMSLSAGIVLITTGYALLALAQLAPGYLSPHYSIRDTSRELGTLLAGFSGTVDTSGGDGLFRENTLRYRTVWGRRWPPHKPEVIVIVFAFADPQDLLAREYCQIREYPLYIAPTFYRAYPREWPTSALGQTARVYRRRPAPGTRTSLSGETCGRADTGEST
jgi:hypothetical protein